MPGSLDIESRNVTRAALLGRDYRGVNVELLCAEGDRVQAGAVMMRDARRPDIRICAPRAGRVERILRGPRRRLVAVQIEIDDDLGSVGHEAPASREQETLRRFLLETGTWSSLRTRPFGNIPHPDAQPSAIFVTALDTEPMAPDPRPIIDACADEFQAAVVFLSAISAAPLYVCHAPGHALAFTQSAEIHCVPFSGGYSAGLPGTHIHALCPIGFAGDEVWHLGYQDVIALGHLLLHGSPWLQRVISIGGSAVTNPRSLLVTPGASIDEILRGEIAGLHSRVLAGSPVCGRPLGATERFLSAGQRQITALEVGDADDVGAAQRNAPLIPSERLERLAPPGIYAVPLMRALQIGDAERARELGALELGEEDLAPLSHACVSGSDYGLLLRRVLEQLEGVH
jgi:Na+-transporting NADH:ubiquinone oxidoreductase subunit A